jgi:hypothetical protein
MILIEQEVKRKILCLINMDSILIDFNQIIRPNIESMSRFITKVSPIPDTLFTIGLVLVIPVDIKKKLDEKEKGYSRVQYLNSKEFTTNILKYSYLVYEKERKICELIHSFIETMDTELMSVLIDNCLQYLPNDILLWTAIQIQDISNTPVLEKLLEYGFADPYICKVSPLGFVFKDYSVCLSRKNDILTGDKEQRKEETKQDIKYILSEFLQNDKGYCTLTGKLSTDAIVYLRSISKMGSSWNGTANITQKEVAGRLLAKQVIETAGKTIYILDIDRDSIVTGEEEGVEIVGSLYNFHSHPREAYDRHKVSLGWPSAQDYIGTMASAIKYGTILHIVASLEGFYVISLGEYWLNNMTKLNQLGSKPVEFISTNYNIRYTSDQDSLSYVRKVNSIAYDGFPLFQIQFFTWDDAYAVFTVPYRKTNGNCFARETTLEKYDHLYV